LASMPLTLALRWTVEPVVMEPERGVIDAWANSQQPFEALAVPLVPTAMAAVRGVIRATAAALPTFLTTPSLRRQLFRRPGLSNTGGDAEPFLADDRAGSASRSFRVTLGLSEADDGNCSQQLIGHYLQ
jgi:hypothetical protein